VLTLGLPVAAVFLLDLAIWEAAFAYAGGAVILWALFRAHMRVVIEEFADYTTPPGQPTDASGPDGSRNGKTQIPTDPGAAVLLANKLAELRDLYGFVDDPDKTPAPGRAAGATVQLDDASGVLRSAVTTESTVSLGPIKLPWGALMGAIAKFSQAPQLRGAIHGDERALILTSELTRHRQRYSWRVSAAVAPGASPRQKLESMVVDELAYQVFSDLTLQRQARWPATKYWLIALGKMAECQRRPRNRRLLLKEAEQNFMGALAEDERFYLACLNLGIVYRRLALELESQQSGDADAESGAGPPGAQRYRRAARRVFERAIDLRPDRWEAYHALADVHWTPHDTSASLEMIPGLCQRALDRRPDRASRARILDLKAHAEVRAAEIAFKNERYDEADGLIRTAVKTRRRACRAALKELRKARMQQVYVPEARRLDTLEKQASQCLINLASTVWAARRLARRRHWQRSKAAFRWIHSLSKLSAKLSDLDAQGHDALARMAGEAGRTKTAAKQLSAASRIAPWNALYASKLARTLAPSGGRPALDACERAERLIDFGLTEHTEAAEELIAAYAVLSRKLPEAGSKADAIRGRRDLPNVLQEALGKDDPVSKLTSLLEGWPKRRDWEKARIEEALGTTIIASDDKKLGNAEERGRRADSHLGNALDWFVDNQPAHRRVTKLHAERAEALALVPACSGDALVHAETAVALDPLLAGYRDVLASAYESGGDLDSALQAAEAAVLLEPDVPRRHYRKAKLRWALAESLADPAAHNAQRRAASEEFEHALMLYESDEKGERRATSWWLARSYFAMSRFHLVPPHLRFVLGSIAEGGATEAEQLVRAAGEMWLAMTYRKLQDFYAAEHHARKAIEAAEAIDASMAHDPDRLMLIFPSEMDDPDWPLGLILVLAHVQLSSSLTERGAGLEDASTSLAAAHTALGRMAEMEQLSAAQREAESDYEAARGRLLLAEGDPEGAIEALRSAADLDPGEADVYLLLARAHARAAEERVEQEWQTHIRDGRNACRRTREIGGEGHPDTLAAAETERQLKRIERTAQGYGDFAGPLLESPKPGHHATPEPTDTPDLDDVVGPAQPAEKSAARGRGRRKRVAADEPPAKPSETP
jgi:tetratricopeptide (TPR) repeat protein